MDLVPYAVPFFLLLIGIEYCYGRARGCNTYRLNDSINSLSMGILSTAIKLVGLDIGGRVFAEVSANWSFPQLDPRSVWTWILALVLYDFCYYWFHRISHERMIFWASHVAHHQSEEYNLTTALRQTSTGFLLSWVFYVPLFAVGVPVEVFVTVASVDLIYQFWIHTRHVPKLGFLERFLITASNHRVHHAQNACYVDKNYGGMLIIWDRLFGTFEEERDDEAPVYGILGPLHSWNPLWANLHIYALMLRDAWFTRSAADKLHVLYARTGWRPADVSVRFPVHKPGLENFRRFDPPLVAGVRGYLWWQLVALVALSLLMEHGAAALAWPVRLSLFVYLLGGLMTLGTLMERYAMGRRIEWLRLGLTALLAGVLAGTSGVADIYPGAMLLYAALSGALLWRVERLQQLPQSVAA